MRAARDYADKHCLREISVPELAREARLEVSQFHKLFRAYTGKSPYNYLQALRARHAHTAIRQGRSRLADVATECGHADQSALTRAIKRHYGVTPGSLRRAQTA